MPINTNPTLAEVPSGYRGSEKTAERVREQIRERFGDEVAETYIPSLNTRTFKSWLAVGYRVKRGEKALTSITFIEKKDAKGNVIKKYPKKVCLFHINQVEPISNS